MSYCTNKMADICAFIQNSIVILNEILGICRRLLCAPFSDIFECIFGNIFLRFYQCGSPFSVVRYLSFFIIIFQKLDKFSESL